MVDLRRTALGSTANELLLDRAIAHAVYLERLKAHEVRRIVAFLNDKVYPDLLARLESRMARIGSRGADSGLWSTQRWQDLVDGVREVIRAGMSEVIAQSKAGLGEIAKAEATWQAGAIARSLGPLAVKLDVVVPAPSMLRSIVTQRPALGNLVSEFWHRQGKATVARVLDQVSIGFTAGEGVPEIARRIRGTRDMLYTDGILETDRRSAEAIVRTTINHTTTQAREELYGENADVIKGIVIVATLDTKTTPTCRAYDGQVFKPGEGPRPPFHWGCRTTTAPVLKSWKELGIGLKEFPEGTRASMNGQVPQSLTYDGWLRRMDGSPETRHLVAEALGRDRAALFRDGASVKDFVGAFNRPLTLEQIERRGDF